MSKEAVATFLKGLDENEGLRTAFFAAFPGKDRDAARVAAFAGKHGFAFTGDELQKEAERHVPPKDGTLSDDQLNDVVGGIIVVGGYGASASRLLYDLGAWSRTSLYR